MDGNSRAGSEIAKTVWVVATPLIWCIGAFGNITTILVFMKKQRRTSTTLYLTWVAITDFAILCLIYPRWWVIYVFGVDFRTTSTFLCKTHMFMVYTLGTTSFYVLVAVTIERIISVILPHRIKHLCTPKTALFVAGGITSVIIVFNLHLTYGFGILDSPTSDDRNMINETEAGVGLEEIDSFDKQRFTNNKSANTHLPKIVSTIRKCVLIDDPTYAYFYKYIYGWTMNILSIWVPIAFFMTGGAIIIWKLLLSQRFRQGMRGVGTKKIDNMSRQITITLLMVNVVFIVCVSPVCIFLTIRPYVLDTTGTMTETQEILWAVFNQLYFINHAVNMAVYSLTGAKFRRQVSELYGCRKPVLLPDSQRSRCQLAIVGDSSMAYSICETSSEVHVETVN